VLGVEACAHGVSDEEEEEREGERVRKRERRGRENLGRRRWPEEKNSEDEKDLDLDLFVAHKHGKIRCASLDFETFLDVSRERAEFNASGGKR